MQTLHQQLTGLFLTISETKESPTCPFELWITLDLAPKEWRKFSRFTLRLSWPASFPADFLVEVYDPRTVLAHYLNSSSTESQLRSSKAPTRRKYARIRIVDTGVLTPSSSTPSVEPVPFILILEPLYFGVLPASVVPILVFLLLVIGLAGFAVPWITRYIEGVTGLARNDIGAMARKRV